MRITANTANMFRMRMQAEPEFRSVINDDWTFSVSGIVGAAHLLVTLPDGWVVKSILKDGRDIAESSLAMGASNALEDLRVVISNHAAAASGQAANSQGAPSDATVIMFSSDSGKWVQDSRFIRAVRSDEDGRFQINGLPPGEYFAVAVDYVQEGTWNDPQYLENIRRAAQRVVVSEGAAVTLSLRLTTP